MRGRTAILRCAVCRASSAPGESAIAEGWFHCEHCGGHAAIPGAGVTVTEGPEQRLAEVARPGRFEIVVRAGPLGDAARVLPALLLFDLVAGRAVAILRHYSPIAAILAGIPLYLAVILWAVRRVRAARGEQRLAVGDDGVLSIEHRIGRRRIERLRTGLALLRASKVGNSRLVISRDDRTLGELRLADRRDLDWAMPRVYAATKATRQVEIEDGLRCDGCGGAVATGERLLREGGIACPHCGTGLVHTRAGLHLAPIALELPPELVAGTPEGAGAASLPRRADFPPLAPGGVDAIGFVLATALAALLLAPLPWLVRVAVHIPLIATAAAAGLVVLVGRMARRIASMHLVHRTIEVDGDGVEVARVILGRRRHAERIPTARIVAVEAKVDEHDFDLRLRGATRDLAVTLPRRGAETDAALRGVVAAIVAAAEAMGRGSPGREQETREPTAGAASGVVTAPLGS